MAFYNDPDGDGEPTPKKEVGENCTLFLPGGDGDDEGVPVTNVSFSEEANTSEVQYTDSFAQSIAVTGVTYSGSFEIPGNANDTWDITWEEDSERGHTLPSHVGTMTIQDSQGRNWNFTDVLINSHSKDVPSDDRTTQSFDFMAETMTYSEDN
jgi:hypothetical protein